jgi:hypothetical protein
MIKKTLSALALIANLGVSRPAIGADGTTALMAALGGVGVASCGLALMVAADRYGLLGERKKPESLNPETEKFEDDSKAWEIGNEESSGRTVGDYRSEEFSNRYNARLKRFWEIKVAHFNNRLKADTLGVRPYVEITLPSPLFDLDKVKVFSRFAWRITLDKDDAFPNLTYTVSQGVNFVYRIDVVETERHNALDAINFLTNWIEILADYEQNTNLPLLIEKWKAK